MGEFLHRIPPYTLWRQHRLAKNTGKGERFQKGFARTQVSIAGQ
ncbi:hypothetical protein JL2886_00285 [Phaeobacter gallaeciensis]|uniref:Uncharacterized protein n=1 Tax=Phaeobacter gallaeciensis TaxID=60890 RepID=A0A1B0ZM75_9RHOB|nr:hypothetical protein JL2886_00285 [Phaeobacter gallaeciensis]